MTEPINPGDPGPADPSPTVSLALEINIGGEKVQFTVNVSEGPATWDQLLPFMRALIKVGSDISQEYFAAKGQTISCRAGCGICCRQRVPLAEFEAHRLRQLVDSMPEPRRSEIRQRFLDAETRARDAGLTLSSEPHTAVSIEELTNRAKNYFKLMIPCPFLENESCSIYEERPLKCREYLVSSPAEYCAEPDQQPVVGLPLPLNVYRTTLFLDDDRRSPGIRWVPLTELISWTDANSPEPPTRTGQELLNEFMTKLVQPKQEH